MKIEITRTEIDPGTSYRESSDSSRQFCPLLSWQKRYCLAYQCQYPAYCGPVNYIQDNYSSQNSYQSKKGTVPSIFRFKTSK
jgi:hypothetical protein